MCVCVYIYIYTYIYIHKKTSSVNILSSGYHSERRAIIENFCCGNTQTTSYKTRKNSSDFCLTFYAVESVTNVSGVRQI